MRRSRAAAACAALALAAAPAAVTAAVPDAKAPPRMLHGDQWFKGYGLWA